MKKVLFISVIAVVLFFSCKREHSAATSPAGKKYRVSLNILNFKQSQGTFSNKRIINALASDTLTNLNSYFDVLYYVVYDNNTGRAINPPVMRDSTMANMGMITDSLPAGSYEVRIVAGKKNLALNNYFVGFDATYGYGGYNWQDTFWAKSDITVGNADISKEVTLNRAVGKVEVQLLDDIPASADSIIMTITPEYATMNLDRGQAEIADATSTTIFALLIPASAKGHPFTFDKIAGNTLTPFTVDIKCKDASDVILGHAIIYNVSSPANMKAVLAGNLFNNGPPSSSPQAFQVKIDTAWNSVPNQESFSLRRH